MSTPSVSLWLFVATVVVLLTTILLKVGKLRSSPHLALVPEQIVDIAQGGAYALWLTGGPRGVWMPRLLERYPKVRLIESSTGAAIDIRYPLFSPKVRGFGSYRQFAFFSIERPGRYTLSLTSSGTQATTASTARLILERRWRWTSTGRSSIR
jgi:hypothetical protein